jgi:hypothetical protein
MLAANYGYIENPLPGTVTPPPTTLPDGSSPPSISDEDIRAGVAHWNIRDALTKTATASGDTAYVGIIVADANGVFDPLNPSEETEFDAAPDTSANTYSSGADLVIAVSSDNDPTGGYETYPRWFYISNLDHGAAIRSFNIRNPVSAISQSLSGGTYKFTVTVASLGDTVGTVKWVEGATPYWDFGTFEVYGRVAKDYLIQQITNKGVVGTTLNDGATWEDTDGEINANFTMTSDTEDLYFELVGEAADVAFGLPTLAVTASGQVLQYNAVLIWGTDATGVDPIELQNDGWKPMSKAGMDEVAFYYVVDPIRDGCIPGTGGVIDLKVPITINDAALTASTEYEYEAWVLDWQNVDNVAIGATTTSLPGNNGFISDPGCDSVVEPLALTLSTGALATPQLMGHFTTNA